MESIKKKKKEKGSLDLGKVGFQNLRERRARTCVPTFMKLVAPEPCGEGAAAEFLEKYGSHLN